MFFFGDYTNIAAHQGQIRPIWMRMDKGKLSVWTALINDESLTDIDEGRLVPVYEYQLLPNHPNPFGSLSAQHTGQPGGRHGTSGGNSSTTIEYKIPSSGNVELKIYSIEGDEIVTLVDQYKSSGNHEVIFDVNNINMELSSGVYIYKIVSGTYKATRKMLFLR